MRSPNTPIIELLEKRRLLSVAPAIAVAAAHPADAVAAVHVRHAPAPVGPGPTNANVLQVSAPAPTSAPGGYAALTAAPPVGSVDALLTTIGTAGPSGGAAATGTTTTAAFSNPLPGWSYVDALLSSAGGVGAIELGTPAQNVFSNMPVLY